MITKVLAFFFTWTLLLPSGANALSPLHHLVPSETNATTEKENTTPETPLDQSITIKAQGSFAVGGTIIQNPGTFDNNAFKGFSPVPEGQTFHGDHAQVFYQIPQNEKKLSMVFLHGAGQSSKSWQTTPDGREGFNNLFLRKGYGVYLVDQPRRGSAGRSTISATLIPAPDEQMWYDIWRMGLWPTAFEGTQFPMDDESLNQFFRQMTPNTGAFDVDLVATTLAKLFDKAGSGILVTHSQGGLPGWYVPILSNNVKAVVAYEPGNYVFPEGELPEPITGLTGTLTAQAVRKDDFMKLTKIPIIIYFGDFIPTEPSTQLGAENWRTRMAMGKKFVEAVNKYGGDATLIHLPEIGIYGNTHFLFAEKNNVQLADLLANWMNKKNLDK